MSSDTGSARRPDGSDPSVGAPAAFPQSTDRTPTPSGPVATDGAAYGDAAIAAELGDEYEILEELGRGGSAVVYRALDRRLQREIALKVVRLPPAFAAGEREDAVARLAREARTVARLEHPNIVGVHAVHELRDGLAVSMPLVRGPTLKQLLAREGPLSTDRATRVLRDVAVALDFAHDRGVVHRDVKPENIFIDEATGRALLSDFGSARTGPADVRVTRTGTTVGTPAYMSPEQIDGAPVDARTDIYSLGLVAWETLTGRRPWEGEGLYGLLHRQKHEPVPPIPSARPAEAGPVPLTLQYVVERMLEKHPAARWASAAAVASQLERPVLPPDFKLWQRAHERRVAQHARVARTAGVSPVAPTERLVTPSSAAVAQPVAHAAAARDADDAETEEARPSWARAEPPPPKRRRRRALVTVLVVLVLAAVASPFFLVDTPQELARAAMSMRIVDESPGSVVVPARRASPAARPAAPPIAPPITPPPAPAVLPSPVPPTESTPLADAGTPPPPPAAPEAPAADTESAAPSADSAPAPPEPAPTRAFIPAPTRAPKPAPKAVAAAPATPPIESASAPPRATASAPRPAPARAATAPVAGRFVVTSERGLVAAGGRHSCALDGEGRAICWGANESGQLGTGDLAPHDSPAEVLGDQRFAQLTTGGAHTCGITDDGAAYCWGDDDHGQLGDATSALRDAPVKVTGSWSFRELRAGLDHTCGVTTSNAVLCWGANARGQLGDGSTRGRAYPAVVRGGRAVTVAAGWRHTCALGGDGVATCWGDNADGQLGDGTRTARDEPTPVQTPLRFTAIAAGATHTCAVAVDGDTYCWGRGAIGASAQPLPLRIDAPARFATLVAGSVHTCGRTSAGAVYCWGRNPYGQLGDGTTIDRWRPVRVPGGPYTSLSAAGAHTCARQDGAPVCWGYNVSGQIGDGTRAHRASPTRPTGGTE